MKRWRLAVLACSFLVAAEARAGGGGGMAGGFGGVEQPKPSSGQGWTGSFGGAMGVCGFGGLGGCCGGITGCGFSMTGCCGFGGCMGGMPMGMMGMMGMQAVDQSYSSWAPSPGQTYYYRTLQVKTPPPNPAVLEFILTYHSDRPKFFYFYDPVDRKYFGRYVIGGKPEQCFSVLTPANRRASVADIAESVYGGATIMPTFAQVIRTRPGTTVQPALHNVMLLRPPESLPNEQLGLPPEEPALKKK